MYYLLIPNKISDAYYKIIIAYFKFQSVRRRSITWEYLSIYSSTCRIPSKITLYCSLMGSDHVSSLLASWVSSWTCTICFLKAAQSRMPWETWWVTIMSLSEVNYRFMYLIILLSYFCWASIVDSLALMASLLGVRADFSILNLFRICSLEYLYRASPSYAFA